MYILRLNTAVQYPIYEQANVGSISSLPMAAISYSTEHDTFRALAKEVEDGWMKKRFLSRNVKRLTEVNANNGTNNHWKMKNIMDTIDNVFQY